MIFDVPPLHVSATFPVKPATGATVSVVLPACPRATVNDDGELLTLKSAIPCENAVEVLPAKSTFVEANTATTLCVPALSEEVAYVALPAESVTVADAVPLPST